MDGSHKAMAVMKPDRLLEVAQHRRSLIADLPDGITMDDLLRPEFWRAVASMVRPGDRIEANAADGTFHADLIVQDVGATWVKMKVHHLSRHDAEPEVAADAWKAEFSVVHRHAGWTVLRNKDGSSQGAFGSQIEAEQAAARLWRK